jgi:hypothetical protein
VGDESLFKLRTLTERDDEPIEDIIRRGLDYLGRVEAKATLELRLLDAENPESVNRYSVRLSPEGASLDVPGPKRPQMVAITTVTDFRDMAKGSYSPLQAYLDGRLRIEGNVDLGRIISQQFGGLGTLDQVCPILVSGTYNVDVQSLTLVGDFFTPGGTVVLDYDLGGDTYQNIVVADSRGSFTVSEGGISCGPIPGSLYGAIVTAFDQSSGKSTTKGFATPC